MTDKTLSFKKQLDSEVTALKSDISKAYTKAAKEAWKVAVNATYVDTGNAQAGWKLSTRGRYGYPKRPVRKKGKTGRIKSKPTVPKFKFRATKDRNVYLYNNVPYIFYLEHGINPWAVVPPTYALKKAEATFISVLKKELK